MSIILKPDGSIVAIHSDNTADMMREAFGAIDIKRASHVEPNAAGEWEADLAPVNGPVLGPYTHRADALAAEVKWLNENL